MKRNTESSFVIGYRCLTDVENRKIGEKRGTRFSGDKQNDSVSHYSRRGEKPNFYILKNFSSGVEKTIERSSRGSSLRKTSVRLCAIS